MKLSTKLLALSLSSFIGMSYAKKVVHESEIFGKWHAWQQIVEDRDLRTISAQMNDQTLAVVKESYESNLPAFGSTKNFLHSVTGGRIGTNGYLLKPPLDEQMRRNYEVLHHLVEENTPEFVTVLARSGLCGARLNSEDEQPNYDQTINKYKAISDMLFPVADLFEKDEVQIAFANRLLEYAISPETFPHYQTLLSRHEDYPTVRFMHTVMWNALVGFGWKHWHKNAIRSIAEAAHEGKELVYLAGGTDFYQLMRKDVGVYSMTIIDPFLPTQARYYSEGWVFLIDGEAAGGGINDEIRFGPGFDSIKMVRTSHTEGENFSLKTSDGKYAEFKKSETVWTVFSKHGEQLGEIKIIRRPVVQKDLESSAKKELISSYDEAAYISLPETLGGWGIDPLILSEDTKIIVKQMRKPITKKMLINLRVASMINFSDVRYINFASDPT